MSFNGQVLEPFGKPQWFPNQLRGSSSQGWTRWLGCLIRGSNPSLPPRENPQVCAMSLPFCTLHWRGQVLTRPDCFSSLPASLCAVPPQPGLKKSHLASSQINFTKQRSICSCGFDCVGAWRWARILLLHLDLSSPGTVFHSGRTNIHSYQQCMVPFSLYCHQHLLCLFYNNHSNRWEWYITVVLMCISLMIREVKHHILVSHLYVFHGKIPIQSLSPLFFLSWTVL